MGAATQILVEPGNPFGFDSEEFADLVDGVREDLAKIAAEHGIEIPPPITQ